MIEECLGVVATLFILIAFTQTGELKIRVLDTVGAMLFVVYGLCIHSFSTVLLNCMLIIIQCYKLIKLRRT